MTWLGFTRADKAESCCNLYAFTRRQALLHGFEQDKSQLAESFKTAEATGLPINEKGRTETRKIYRAYCKLVSFFHLRVNYWGSTFLRTAELARENAAKAAQPCKVGANKDKSPLTAAAKVAAHAPTATPGAPRSRASSRFCFKNSLYFWPGGGSTKLKGLPAFHFSPNTQPQKDRRADSNKRKAPAVPAAIAL